MSEGDARDHRRSRRRTMSTLSLDPAVSLFEPATRPAAVVPTAAPVRSSRSAGRDESLARHGRRSARPQATHARRSALLTAPGLAGLARAAQLVAVRALGTSVAAAAVTWALMARSSGGAADLATSSLRGLAAAAVLCAARPPRPPAPPPFLGAAGASRARARLGALGATRTWYGTASLLAIAHSA